MPPTYHRPASSSRAVHRPRPAARRSSIRCPAPRIRTSRNSCKNAAGIYLLYFQQRFTEFVKLNHLLPTLILFFESISIFIPHARKLSEIQSIVCKSRTFTLAFPQKHLHFSSFSASSFSTISLIAQEGAKI